MYSQIIFQKTQITALFKEINRVFIIIDQGSYLINNKNNKFLMIMYNISKNYLIKIINNNK